MLEHPIVSANDFAISSAMNDAIVRAFEMGIIDRTSAITNAPLFADASQLAIEKGFENPVGVHFNILEGRAISSKNADTHSFCSKGGMFTYQRNAKLFFSRREMDTISAECEDQIRRYHEQGLHPTLSCIGVVIDVLSGEELASQFNKLKSLG